MPENFIPLTRWPSCRADANPVDYWVWSVEQKKICRYRITDIDEAREPTEVSRTAVGQCQDKTRTVWTHADADADYASLTLQAYYLSISCFSLVLIKCDTGHTGLEFIVHWFYSVIWVDLKSAMIFFVFPMQRMYFGWNCCKILLLITKLQRRT